MKLPNAEHIRVDKQKITGYLLCESHPDGAGKAEFFGRFGFCLEEWQRLVEALKRHGQGCPVTNRVESEYGTRYTVDGLMETPLGRRPRIRTVWIVDKGGDQPRLVTAHPI